MVILGVIIVIIGIYIIIVNTASDIGFKFVIIGVVCISTYLFCLTDDYYTKYRLDKSSDVGYIIKESKCNVIKLNYDTCETVNIGLIPMENIINFGKTFLTKKGKK